MKIELSDADAMTLHRWIITSPNPPSAAIRLASEILTHAPLAPAKSQEKQCQHREYARRVVAGAQVTENKPELMSLVLPEQDWHKLEHAVNQLAWNPGSLASEGVAAFNRAIAEACGYGKKAESDARMGAPECQRNQTRPVVVDSTWNYGRLTNKLSFVDGSLCKWREAEHEDRGQRGGVWVRVPNL